MYIRKSVIPGNKREVKISLKPTVVKIIDIIKVIKMLIMYIIIPALGLKGNKIIDTINKADAIISNISCGEEIVTVPVKFFSSIKFKHVFIDTNDNAIWNNKILIKP